MKNLVYALLLAVVASVSASAQIGNFTVHSSASYVRSLPWDDNSPGTLVADRSLLTLYVSGSPNFPATGTCTPSAPYPTSAGACGIRVNVWYGSSHYAQVTYVSTTQINFIMPTVAHDNGYDINIRVEKDNGGGSWQQWGNETHDYYHNSPEIFYTYQNTNYYANAGVWGFDGTYTGGYPNYVLQRNVVDTGSGAPNDVPRTYNGLPTVIAFYVTGVKHAVDHQSDNPATTVLKIKVDGGSLVTVASSDFANWGDIEQINWTVPSGSASVMTFEFYVVEGGVTTPGACNTVVIPFGT